MHLVYNLVLCSVDESIEEPEPAGRKIITITLIIILILIIIIIIIMIIIIIIIVLITREISEYLLIPKS